MTPADAARVLAKAAAFDQRTIGRADVAAWHEALADLDAADALDAVTRHYRESTDRLMPAHVRRHAAEIDRLRRQLARERAEAAELEALRDDQTRRDRSAAVAELLAELRDRLPPGDPAKLRRPDMLAADQARARAARAEPNPHYDPAALAKLADMAAAAGGEPHQCAQADACRFDERCENYANCRDIPAAVSELEATP